MAQTVSAPWYRVIPVAVEIAHEVRQTGKAPGYGHPAFVDVASGYGPCRVCLRPMTVGEDQRILFTYDPFAGRDPFPLPGPIYVHAHDCPPHEGGRFPDELAFIPLTFNAYGAGRRLVVQERVADGHDGRVERVLSRLFGDPTVDYVHVRNTEAGCFIANVERC